MPFMVVLSVHLSLSLLLISAQFFVEACVASTVACVENTGKPHLKLIVAVSHPLVQTAGWQGTVRDWSVVYSPLRCRCAETVVLNYPLHCWLVTLPPQEFDSANMPSLFVFTSWAVSESATRMPPAGGQPFFSTNQPRHLCSLGSLAAFSLLFLYVPS